MERSKNSETRFSVAPMMDWTDRFCRYFHRVLTRHARLYTEMVTAAAAVHGDRARLLAFDPAEHPVALQVGGADPALLAEAARIGEAMGYDEINLNCGCPSDRVQSGCFGAALMAEPRRVAVSVEAMRSAVAVPVTVKCRIGIDEQDPEVALEAFVRTVSEAGCTTFVVHARKAWLKGLSPKENREIPPLDHALVHRLKAAHPELSIVLNGGIATLDEAARHLGHVDGVMLGRAAYQNPGILAEVDHRFFDPAAPVLSPEEAVRAYMPFVERELARGARLQGLVKPLIGLFQGRPGARAFRRVLSEGSLKERAGPELLEAALRAVERQPLPEAA